MIEWNIWYNFSVAESDKSTLIEVKNVNTINSFASRHLRISYSFFFETDRLLVRQYMISDIGELLQVMSDIRVHTYTKDKNRPWDKHRTEEYIRYMMSKDFKTLDCFHGAVIEKITNQLIGLCGLNPYKVNEPEIEFKIGVPSWNKGYATELGKQMIRDSFATTNIKGIYGMAQPENIASRKVLENIGMKYLGNQVFRNHEDSFYYIGNLKQHTSVC